MNFFDNFSDFWEILTGVIDDNKAKIIRWICFAILIFGIGWAIFNYFRANILSNTEVNAFSQGHYVPEDDGKALKQMADLAQTVDSMRRGGETIAAAIDANHTKPFNVKDSGESSDLTAMSQDVQPAQTAQEDTSPEIFVRAIMMAGKTRAAVIDAGEDFKGHMVRRGTVLPNGLGRVTDITSNKVTVRRDRRNYEYIVGKLETDLERKLQGKSPVQNNSNSSRPSQTQVGVEQFVFEGTVPEDSPLTTSVKEEELKK